MLEVAESLECGDNVALSEETDLSSPDIPSFKVLEILPSYGPLVDGKVVESRPLN